MYFKEWKKNPQLDIIERELEKKKQQWLPIPKNQDVEVWNRKKKSMKKILKNKVPAKSDEAIKKLVSRIIQMR